MKAKTTKSKDGKRTRTRAKNCPSAELRVLVDAAAFRLFMENGYENTTMRQISEETGFGAGSLYNTFSGKEDILKDIVDSTYTLLIERVEEYLEDDIDPLVAISFPMCAELYAASVNPRYAEILNVAHTTWPIVNMMVDRTVEWEHKYITQFDESITPEIMKRNLTVNAAAMGIYVMKFHKEGPQDAREAVYMCMKVFCSLFGVERDNLDEIVDLIMGLFSEELVMGFFDVKGRDSK